MCLKDARCNNDNEHVKCIQYCIVGLKLVLSTFLQYYFDEDDGNIYRPICILLFFMTPNPPLYLKLRFLGDIFVV